MSYFDFINQTSSYSQDRLSEHATPSFLSVSIADELYESQTFSNASDKPLRSTSGDTIKKQSPLAGSSQDPTIPCTSPTLQDYSNGFSSRASPVPSTGTSVFGFINQSVKQNGTQAVDELVFTLKQSVRPTVKSPPVSTVLQHQVRQQHQTQQAASYIEQQEIDMLSASPLSLSTNRNTVEMQRLYEESNWKRAKAGKQHQQQLVQQLYERRKVIIAEIQSNLTLLQSNSQDKQRARDDEDYDKLDKLTKQQRLVESNLDRLKYDVWESTTQQLHTTWMKMSSLTRAEGECASKVAQMYQGTKDERQQQLNQYNVDMKRKHDSHLEEIKAARYDIESSKSELAFDFDFWKQAKAELDEKMAEAVQEKTQRKNKLTDRLNSTEEEITAIKKKLEDLVQKRQTYNLEISYLEHDIEQSLLPYQSEINAQEREHHEMNSRKIALEQRSSDLDRRDAALQQKLALCHQYEDQGWKEVNDLDDAIRQAATESSTNASDADAIMSALDRHILDRDNAIKEIVGKQKRTSNDIKQLQNQIEQQQIEYNNAQQQMDDDDARLNFSKLQKIRMTRQQAKAVEQEQYQLAAKWKEQIKQIDLASDQGTKILADNQTRLDNLDSDLNISREQLHELLTKYNAQERESVEAIITLLNQSEEALTQINNTSWIVEYELDSIKIWKSYLRQYLTAL